MRVRWNSEDLLLPSLSFSPTLLPNVASSRYPKRETKADLGTVLIVDTVTVSKSLLANKDSPVVHTHRHQLTFTHTHRHRDEINDHSMCLYILASSPFLIFPFLLMSHSVVTTKTQLWHEWNNCMSDREDKQLANPKVILVKEGKEGKERMRETEREGENAKTSPSKEGWR